MLSPNQIKQFRALRDKEYRFSQGTFAAETPKVILDLIRFGFQPICIYSTNINTFEDASAIAIQITEKELERLSFLKQPNTACAIFSIPVKKQFVQKPITLILDAINDPGNMGTIIRSAHWFGIETIITTPKCVDIFNPKVVQSTMGSLAAVAVYEMSVKEIQQQFTPETCFYGAFMDGHDVRDLQLSVPAALVIGSEAHGISDLLPVISQRISIPAANPSNKPESLNAAVAAAILMNSFVHVTSI